MTLARLKFKVNKVIFNKTESDLSNSKFANCQYSEQPMPPLWLMQNTTHLNSLTKKYPRLSCVIMKNPGLKKHKKTGKNDRGRERDREGDQIQRLVYAYVAGVRVGCCWQEKEDICQISYFSKCQYKPWIYTNFTSAFHCFVKVATFLKYTCCIPPPPPPPFFH